MATKSSGYTRSKDGLILFGTGILGSAVREVFESNYWPVIQYDRKQKDFKDSEPSFEEILSRHPNSRLVINTAAMTDVDGCEDKYAYADALIVNGSSLYDLGIACHNTNKKMIHVSTNHVFDGEKQFPYDELDAVNPVNKYGFSKFVGESQLLDLKTDALIVRTGELYNYKLKKGIVHQFTKMVIADGGNWHMISDQLIAPTCAYCLAKQLLVIALKCNERKLPKIIHATCNGQTTPFELATMLKKKYGGKAKIVKTTMENLQSLSTRTANRPKNGILDNTVLKNVSLDIMPNWDRPINKFTQ